MAFSKSIGVLRIMHHMGEEARLRIEIRKTTQENLTKKVSLPHIDFSLLAFTFRRMECHFQLCTIHIAAMIKIFNWGQRNFCIAHILLVFDFGGLAKLLSKMQFSHAHRVVVVRNHRKFNLVMRR